ncbi:MAG: glycoside hydrolase family 27 protein [Bacteroidetes bacterium]|nr:glycoside hydrolase family 27 protein [Bacteroidota bacterium]
MKKISILCLLALLFAASCSTERKENRIDLNIPWKFMPGDDLSWAAPAFDDSKWKTILPDKIWEEQGYEKLDGYAWYRTRFFLPSSLKEKALMKDSLQILLGKIDDCDQVFLNGELIGQNTAVMAAKSPPDENFIKAQGVWNTDRRYVLHVNDQRIGWDKENVIAVRVYDQNGAGGMFSKPFAVSMVSFADYVKFDMTKNTFVFRNDNLLSRKFIIENRSGKDDFNGTLSLKVSSYSNGAVLFHKDTAINLSRNSKTETGFTFQPDPANPVFAEITFRENHTGQCVTEKMELPYILTPSVKKEPRINGAKVFGVRPWSPFLFKVAATGEPPLKYLAKDIPEGLTIDSVSGLITGALKKKGEHMVTLTVKNASGSATRKLKIVCGNTISLTPPLGWNSWNCWGLSVSDEKIRQSADAMRSSGLIDHGWTYINIDDGWEYKHDKDGKILTNSKFPNMYALCSYVHSLGLKIGIYSSPGTKTCGGYEGSYTFEEKDAEAYAAWGIDYLKYDWCSYGRLYPNPTKSQMKYPYQVMRKAIRKVNRDIHYSLCQYGMGDVWEWGAEVDGNSWRTTGDIEDTWRSLSGIGYSQRKCSSFSAPGRWNDPDMLVVGWVGWGPDLHYTRLTPGEQYTHITLWSLLSSPLLIGCDLSQLDPFTLSLLTNDEVLAVNQDPLGKQATLAKSNESYALWIKELEDGSRAIGLFNLTEQPLNIPVDLKELKLKGRWNMRDLWRQTDLGQVEQHFEMKVLPHGANLIRIVK